MERFMARILNVIFWPTAIKSLLFVVSDGFEDVALTHAIVWP